MLMTCRKGEARALELDAKLHPLRRTGRCGEAPRRSRGAAHGRNKGLRGTRWDLFGHTAERRAERALIADYEANIAEVLDTLSDDRLPLALEIARLPETIRGFGHVKAHAMKTAARQRSALLSRWRHTPHGALS